MAWIIKLDPRHEAGLYRKIQDAEAAWREVVGPSIDNVEVSWRLDSEKGPVGPRPVLWMQVKELVENTTSPAQKFFPDEFADNTRLLTRFQNIWGKFLLSGARTHLERFNELVSQFPGD